MVTMCASRSIASVPLLSGTVIPISSLSGTNRGQWGRVCHFNPIYIVDGGGGMYPHPFLYIDGGGGRGEPCQVVLNMKGYRLNRPAMYTQHTWRFFTW